eukprot:137033_1
MNSNGIDISNNNNNNNNNNNDNIYYHSTTNQTYLSPKCLQFCYPMSCNKHLSIVHIFAPKNGIIFALKSKGDNISHFNCNWISDYANYDERIVFGTNQGSHLLTALSAKRRRLEKISLDEKRLKSAMTSLVKKRLKS